MPGSSPGMTKNKMDKKSGAPRLLGADPFLPAMAMAVVVASMLVSLLVPGFASAMGWLFLLHPRIGLVNALAVRGLGFDAPPFNILSLAGMGWVQGLNLTPVTFLMLAGAFRAMDPALEE